MKNPGPAYRIQTPRLILRCWQPADAPLLSTAIEANIEHLRPWMPWIAREPLELQERIQVLRRFRGNFDLGESFVFGIFNLDESQVLGGSGLHTRVGDEALEIGYWIHKDFIGQGLATETSAALTKVAFEVEQVKRLEIHCDPRNLRSAAVPRKLGYTHEATLRKRVPDEFGQYHDSMIWTLLATEYPSSPAAALQITAFDAANRPII